MKNNFCTFYIVRHGESEWNVKRILHGQTKDIPLTPNGLKQANQTAKKLNNIDFAAAYSSDLLRAQRTAEIIALDHNLLVKTNHLLRERYFGRLEGITVNNFLEEFKDLLKVREQLSTEVRFKSKIIPEVESDEEIASRLFTFLREIAVAYMGKNVLIVSHGGLMHATLIKLGFANYQELPYSSIKNTSYFIIDSDGVEFFLKKTFGIKKYN